MEWARGGMHRPPGLRQRSGELLIAVCVVVNAMMRQAACFVTKPAEVGVLMRALAECYWAATMALSQALNMAATKPGAADGERFRQ